MPTVPISLKRLAEIKEALIALWWSELPDRVKRMRERLLKREADQILMQEKLEPIPPGLCTRCKEGPTVPGGDFCHTCITYYLDAVPQWVRDGSVSKAEGDVWVARLIKRLLDNNLIGVPDGNEKDEPRPTGN